MSMNRELLRMVPGDERIMWQGKPDRKSLLLKSVFNPLMPFAIIWAIIDFSIIGFGIVSNSSQMNHNMLFFIIPFFALHLMPVWLYLGGIILSQKRYDNTYYIITNKSIYISTSIITKRILTKRFSEIAHVDLYQGFFDQKLGVGNIKCLSIHQGEDSMISMADISSIREYKMVYDMMKKLQQESYNVDQNDYNSDY